MQTVIDKNQPSSDYNPKKITGQYIIEKFLKLWGEENGNSPIIGLMKSTGSTPVSVSLLKRFIEQIVTPYVANRMNNSNVSTMVSLAAIPLFGLAYTRYILKLEPISSMSVSTISELLAPNITTILNLDLGESNLKNTISEVEKD